ncbi:MAG TPA: hypothetical protein VGW35_20110 [Methylomirabilota bacterium]|jgi:hypothetical protein|nr:hypothetical protein [Methylomirabilota bacterium]
MAPRPRWLFIVRQDQRRLYDHLRQAFEGIDLIEVILDRRRVERRQEMQPVDVDRRRKERRAPLSAAEQELWGIAGFRLVYRTEDLTIYESEGDVPPKGE